MKRPAGEAADRGEDAAPARTASPAEGLDDLATTNVRKRVSASSEKAAGDSADGSLERSIEGLIEGTVAYARALVIIGVTPWRADRLLPRSAEDHTSPMARAATLLSVSSFILSLVAGAGVELFWRVGWNSDAWAEIALKELHTALQPNLPEALMSLFPGILCAGLSASLLARTLVADASRRALVRRLILLTFAADAFVVAVVIAVSMYLLPGFLGGLVGSIVVAAVAGGPRSHSWQDALLEWWFDYGLLIVPLMLALHLPLAIWLGARRLDRTGCAPLLERVRLFGSRSSIAMPNPRVVLVAVLCPLLFGGYAFGLALPHLLITSLSPSEPSSVIVRAQARTHDAPDRVIDINVLIDNPLTKPMVLDRARSFTVKFGTGRDPYGARPADAKVADWEGGTAPFLVVPAGATRWVVLQTTPPADTCSRKPDDTGGKETSAYYRVAISEAGSPGHETSASPWNWFCAMR